MNIDDILPFEVWLTIAELDAQTFIAVRSVNSGVRNYTNQHMEKYRELFTFGVIKDSSEFVETYRQLHNGLKHGLYQKKDHKGQLRVECTYKNGKIEGLYQEWYANVQLNIQCIYKNGKKEGLYQEWYENTSGGDLTSGAQVSTESLYRNGKIDGLYQQWYPDGRHSISCMYKNGQREGLFQSWYGSGQLFAQATYKNGSVGDINWLNL